LSGILFLCLAVSLTVTEGVRAQGSPGALSFTQSSYTVNEGDGNATITLSRTGGTDGDVSAKVTLANVTTSNADYVFNPGALDPTLAEVPEAVNGFLYYSSQIALQPDGKILVGGNRSIVRVNSDGIPDPTFSAGALNFGVSSIAIQTDGKVIIAGSFTTVGGVSKRGVARLNADGTLDNTFDVGVGSTNINVIALQSDGKVLVGGGFTSFNLASNTFFVARLNTDGSVDSTFLNGANVSTTYAIVVQPDGKILLGGLGSVSVVRLNSDGSADNTFNSNLGAPVLSIAVQPDGRIIAGGGFDHAGSQGIYNLARLKSDGSLDGGFNPGSGPDQAVEAIRLQPDGKLVIGGDFRTFNGSTAVNIARLNTDGSFLPGFGTNISSPSGSFIHSLLLQPDGKIIAGGSFTAVTVNFVNRRNLVRMNGDLFVEWKSGDGADKNISLPIVDDLLDESDETLALTVTPLGGASAGATQNATLTIIDNDVPPAITSAPPPQGITRLSYSHTFTATGTPNPTFALTSGTLPPGLFLQSSGVLLGTTATAGTFSDITVTASNGVAPPATQTFSITILSGGTLQFSSASYSVTEDGGSATITVTRTGGSAGATSVNFSTSAGSAAAGTDFTNTFGTLSFADGESSKTFAVPVINDNLDEFDETVNLFLNVVNGSATLGSPTLATLTILDDDLPPTISIQDSVLTEGNSATKSAGFTVTLSAPSGRPTLVNFATTNNTALAGSDYQATSSSLTFSPGVTTRIATVTVLGDTNVEPDETFFVDLTNPQNLILGRSRATATIVNDDNNGGNPIDLAGFFVRQHYVDFLNRQPDTSGLAFWSNQITECQQPGATCDAAVRRINVSAAFFLSIEFQETGYLVERLYKTAYGDATGISNFGPIHQLAVPIVRLNEFLPDTQEIGRGLVVGQPGWEQVLENNKVAFIAAFVQRSRFTTALPTSLTPAQFVDMLFANTGVTPTSAERTSIINEFGGAGTTVDAAARARALRRVAENSTLNEQEKNKAFVLMQYFGYLRRNPNDPQDTDYSGYDFWLTKLNQFNGNFVNADMVQAFIDSGEYRGRFGP